MIRSMTGFGRSRMAVDGLDITVEIKSVNSRFLDCNTKISRAFGYLEERVKPYLLSKGVSRGKVDVWISIEEMGSAEVEIALDEGYVRGYLEALHTLRDRFGLADDISVMSVAANRDIFLVKKPPEDIERAWQALRTVLDAATDAFLEVRRREGESLARDMREKLERLRGFAEAVKELSAKDVATYRERLAERIREALADHQITPDETRLLTECAIHADKVAVDEELVRLGAHFEAFEKILSDGDAVGRRLDFLLQEMNREVNTTGSKCSDAAIAAIVVDAKCELEKIREQIQNLE